MKLNAVIPLPADADYVSTEAAAAAAAVVSDCAIYVRINATALWSTDVTIAWLPVIWNTSARPSAHMDLTTEKGSPTRLGDS